MLLFLAVVFVGDDVVAVGVAFVVVFRCCFWLVLLLLLLRLMMWFLLFLVGAAGAERSNKVRTSCVLVSVLPPVSSWVSL